MSVEWDINQIISEVEDLLEYATILKLLYDKQDCAIEKYLKEIDKIETSLFAIENAALQLKNYFEDCQKNTHEMKS